METLLRVVVVFASFCLLLRVQAGEAGLSGIVKDSKGQPLQGAEVRIQGSDANRIGKVHTAANGRYNYPELEAGVYSVSLIVDGVTKASISNVATKAGETQTLNFEMVKGSRATPFAPGKHYVWIPSTTGSHLGTRAEVEGDGKGMAVGMSERLNNQGNALVRQIQNNGNNQGGPPSH
jgi:Carboxypeptidase regulatory-like domain